MLGEGLRDASFEEFEGMPAILAVVLQRLSEIGLLFLVMARQESPWGDCQMLLTARHQVITATFKVLLKEGGYKSENYRKEQILTAILCQVCCLCLVDGFVVGVLTLFLGLFVSIFAVYRGDFE